MVSEAWDEDADGGSPVPGIASCIYRGIRESMIIIASAQSSAAGSEGGLDGSEEKLSFAWDCTGADGWSVITDYCCHEDRAVRFLRPATQRSQRRLVTNYFWLGVITLPRRFPSLTSPHLTATEKDGKDHRQKARGRVSGGRPSRRSVRMVRVPQVWQPDLAGKSRSNH